MIECQNITKIYKNGDRLTEVLKGINLTIDDGEYVAIVGPSGSGKSTLMNILGALDAATSGQYYLDGREVTTMSEDELADVRSRKIGFVFQSFNLLGKSTVLANVMLPFLYTKVENLSEREEEAERYLFSVGFPKVRWQNRGNELSGGEMQRVAIARALVNNPSILMADEPTGNLDSKTGEIILETFSRLNREGRTIILITHDMKVAKHADRIITLQDGMVVEDTKRSI